MARIEAISSCCADRIQSDPLACRTPLVDAPKGSKLEAEERCKPNVTVALPDSEIGLLKEDPDRQFSIYPIPEANNKIMEMYRTALACVWTPKQCDYSTDIAELKRQNSDGSMFISEQQRQVLMTVLSFFSGSDFIVAENMRNFTKLVKVPEVVFFYDLQVAVENIHSETYGDLINAFSKSETERNQLRTAVFKQPSVQGKANWAAKWMDESLPFAMRLLAFCIVEGVFFSASFCVIFFFKSQNKLRSGLGYTNELISRDEGLHVEFGLHLYSQHIPDGAKPSQASIDKMFEEAYQLECEFVKDALKTELLGLNQNLMIEYVEHVIDFFRVRIGMPRMFPNASNPFPWMEWISLEGKTNFFEQYVSEYQFAQLTVDEEGGLFDAEF